MNLCTGTRSSHHEECVYEDGRSCPACDLADERDEAVSKVEELQDRIKGLEAQL